jgi:hypothetical protein
VYGPFERGHDIVAMLSLDGRYLLRLYQIKTGDISLSTWREARAAMEESMRSIMEDIPKSSGARVQKVGTLILDGHVHEDVQPEVETWLVNERRAYGHEVDVMFLDGLVDWIVAERLTNDLRAALRELGIRTSEG